MDIVPAAPELWPTIAELFAAGGDPKWCWYDLGLTVQDADPAADVLPLRVPAPPAPLMEPAGCAFSELLRGMALPNHIGVAPHCHDKPAVLIAHLKAARLAPLPWHLQIAPSIGPHG